MSIRTQKHHTLLEAKLLHTYQERARAFMQRVNQCEMGPRQIEDYLIDTMIEIHQSVRTTERAELREQWVSAVAQAGQNLGQQFADHLDREGPR